jgi:orotate phosphoribosyltransferase
MVLPKYPENLEDLLKLDPEDFKNVWIPEEELFRWLELCEAAWQHSGNPEDPHAELTSGWCSIGFCNCLGAFKYVRLLEIFADQTALRIRQRIGNRKIDWVIGSPMAGINLAYLVARALGVPKCFFVEKDPANPGKMLWNRMIIPPDETALGVEELITTSKTLFAVREAVNEGNPFPVNWLPFVGVFVHRPPEMKTEYDGVEVIPVIERIIWAGPSEECDLCRQGSVRYKPKTHWKELTGKK